MTKYLNSAQIEELVYENRYTIQGNKFKSRCSHGAYSSNDKLPGLAIPGGDIGELAILLAAANTYGFSLDLHKASNTLLGIIEDISKSTFRSLTEHPIERCSHMHFLLNEPEQYNLTHEDTELLLREGKQYGLIPDSLNKDYERETHDQACLIFEGHEAIFPQYRFDTFEGSFDAQVFIFHKTLVDERHRILSHKLRQNKALDLFDGLDSDYLYQVLSEVSDTHLYEALHKTAPLMPIYSVRIDQKSKISIDLIS